MAFSPRFPIAVIVGLVLAAGVVGYFLPENMTGDARLDRAILLAIGTLAGAWAIVARSHRAAISSAPESDEPAETVFVGNLAFKATEEELRNLFVPFGAVRNARVMRDRKTRRPRGFGFVEMPKTEARRAIQALDGKDFHGRKLRVREGKSKDNGDDDLSS